MSAFGQYSLTNRARVLRSQAAASRGIRKDKSASAEANRLLQIEQRLRSLPELRDAVVMECNERPIGLRLVAYLLARDGQVLSPSAIRAQLSATLAPELIPATFITLDAFPHRRDGDIDRAALPSPDSKLLGKRRYEAPQGPVERAIARIWQELLDLRDIGRHDHFFELGGHSTLGLQLVYRLRQTMDLDIALRELFLEPTLRGFSASVSARIHSKRSSPLVPIRAGGVSLPLFLVHSGDGDIGYAHGIAEWLDPDIPVYGLAASGLEPGEVPLASVEEMAMSYVHAIRTVQAHGPYRVAGWSGGGTIAYEIANQLIGADEPVEFVGLIDTPSRHPWPSSPVAAGQTAKGVEPVFADWLRKLDWIDTGLGAPLRAELAGLAQAEDIDPLLLRCQSCGVLPESSALTELKRELAVRHALALAMSHYARPALPVPLDLFSCSTDTGDASLGWNKLCGDHVHLSLLDGPRECLMAQPAIAQLSAALGKRLQRAADTVRHPSEFDYAARITIHGGAPGIRPLFCVPGAGASVTAFAALTSELDPAIPVHGLQPRGLCGTLVPHVDVPSAARAYLAQVQAAQPRGPYRLLGHSFGGWVVYEMARQLTEAGETVDTLIVLDSDAPATSGYAFDRVTMLMKLIGLFEMNCGRPIGIDAGDLAALDHEAQLVLLLARLVELRVMPPRTTLQTLRGLVRVFAANLNAPYQPAGTYDGPLHLVLVPDQTPGSMDMDELAAHWREHAPRTRLWPGPGNHITLLAAPHVRDLAAYLAPLLREPS